MKVVVSCDSIVQRDYYLEIVEAALEVIGGQCEVYSLVHSHGAVVGPIQERKILSSFLSNFVDSNNDLLKSSYLIPGAAKNLFIPCSVDLIINISRGFSHGIKKCKTTKQVTFLVEDLNQKKRKKSFKEKIFSVLVSSFQKKSLVNSDELWTSNLDLVPANLKDKAKLVMPTLKLTDYKLLPEAMFSYDYILINVEPHSAQEVSDMMQALEQASIKYKFIGEDNHLEQLKATHEDKFFGARCSGEMAPLLAGCKYLVDLEAQNLPTWTLKTMASGRPVYGAKNNFMDFGQGRLEAPELCKSIELSVPELDRNKIRARALAFEELKFKHLLKKTLAQSGGLSFSKVDKAGESNDSNEQCC